MSGAGASRTARQPPGASAGWRSRGAATAPAPPRCRHPDWQAAAVRAITAAAGATVKDGTLPEATHRTLAHAVLTTVWRSGAHFLISPDDWPDLLPEIVLGAVRRAPLVNGEPFMRDLRGDDDQS